LVKTCKSKILLTLKVRFTFDWEEYTPLLLKPNKVKEITDNFFHVYFSTSHAFNISVTKCFIQRQQHLEET